jgi:hypothetical protein
VAKADELLAARRHAGHCRRCCRPLDPWTFCVVVSASNDDPECEKVPICRRFQAADGTRTHDLLHGKQTL